MPFFKKIKYKMKKINQWKSISLFLAVANNKSFTQTAKEKDLSVMMVSKQIKQLEAHLKQQLFTRTTRKVELTEFAEHYYVYCKAIEKTLKNADEFVQSQQREISGILTILLEPMFAEQFILPILADFMRLYPKLAVKITLNGKPTANETEENDILMGYCLHNIDHVTKLRHRRIFASPYILAASPDYIARYGEPRTMEALDKHQFIANTLYGTPMQINLANGDMLQNLNIVLELNSLRVMCHTATTDIGIIKVPYCYAKPFIKTGQLRPLLTSYPLEEFTADVFYKLTTYEIKKIRCFIDFLLQNNSLLAST